MTAHTINTDTPALLKKSQVVHQTSRGPTVDEVAAQLLREALERGEFALTAEVTPPSGGDPSRTLAAAAALRGLVHAVNVTDGSRAVMRMSSLAVCRLLLDAHRLDSEAVATQLGRNLSLGVPPLDAAAWLDGFLNRQALVLLHDDFAAIVLAIHRGRQTFANLRQAMVYTLAVHVPIIGLALLPVLFGLPLVLAPLHIAFLELVIDPACSIVFEAEEGAADLMQQPPRRADEPLLSARHILLSLVQGGVVTAAVVGLYAWLLGQAAHAATASTVAFVVLVAANAALILPSRSNQTSWRSLWAGLTPVSLWVLGGTLAALTAITTVPWLASAFKFAPLPPLHWLMAMVAGLTLTGLFAANKRWLRPTTLAHNHPTV